LINLKMKTRRIPGKRRRAPFSIISSVKLAVSGELLCCLFAGGTAQAQQATQSSTGGSSVEATPPSSGGASLWGVPAPAAAIAGAQGLNYSVNYSEGPPTSSPLALASNAAAVAPPAGSPPGGSAAAQSGAGVVPPKLTHNEIAASADFFYGQGTVSLPFGFSLARGGIAAAPSVAVNDRESTYLGGTVSYSLNQKWYLDFSYANGTSSGGGSIAHAGTSRFTIDDEWYQTYVRYAFRAFKGTPLSAYLRLGVSYVPANLTLNVATADYHQTDEISDVLGNVGFGAIYTLYRKDRLRLGVQLEGEGFGGHRFQTSVETEHGITEPAAAIDNALYGGIGRGTLQLKCELGHSGLLKVFADGGMQGKFSEITYSSVPGLSSHTYSEELWGPYVKVGLRYSF
jgi:hypothetical protein